MRMIAPGSNTLFALLGATLVCTGCSMSTEPWADIPRQSMPFYYYQGQPIYLNVDSTRISIITTLPLPEFARTVLAARGVHVDTATLQYPPQNLRVLWLSRGTSAAQAVAAATLLREASGITFASNAYYSVEGGHPMLLTGVFNARFRPGTPRAEIDHLNRSVGASGGPVDPRFGAPDLWELRYPANSPYTPLEIAAYYEQQPQVEWASPDFFSDYQLGSIRPAEQ